MTTLSARQAVVPTATAKAAVQASGADLPTLMTLADQHIVELRAIVKQIVALHPTGGGDAANYSALQAVLTSLA
jgi:hypothetical protein